MAPTDDDSKDITKSVMDWITRVGALATILATIIGLFFPDLGDTGKKIAYVLAIVFFIGSGLVYYLQRRRSTRKKATEIPLATSTSAAEISVPMEFEPGTQTAILRGPIPFEEGELLPLRGRDVQQLYTLVASSTFRFGVLWGETGCGKTSLLRAGLMPVLKKGGFDPIYVATPGRDPTQAILDSLKKRSPDSDGVADVDPAKMLLVMAQKTKKVVVILDQFEEFFLARPIHQERIEFIHWLQVLLEASHRSVVFLVSIRAGSLPRMQEFASSIPEATSPNTTCPLLNFTGPQAKQILLEATKVDGIPFETDLIDTLVHNLLRNNSVRAVELQQAAFRLKRKNICSLKAYVAPIQPRVLLIVINPVIDPASGKTLIETQNWNDPEKLAAQFIEDIQECSDGLVNYQIAERGHYGGRENVYQFPQLEDGFQYQPQEYLDALYGKQPFHPGFIDYRPFIKDYNLLERVARNEFDEVWLFGFPGAGLYESTMAGKSAFFCNSMPLPETEQCPRRFLLLGINYEKSFGEMLHMLGHRVESIMVKVYNGKKGKENLFSQFTLYDKIAPGLSNVGSIHFPPNATNDYDYASMTSVRSFCDDWLNFPAMTGMVRIVDASEWGSGNMRLHHKWWLSHLPKAPGSIGGISNNWWKYIIDPNNIS
jgi:hypothetical protein